MSANGRDELVGPEPSEGPTAAPGPGSAPAPTAGDDPAPAGVEQTTTGATARRGRVVDGLLGPLAVVLAAVYPAVEITRIVVQAAPRPTWGDSALIELDARRAARFDQLLGAYSRVGFHHPGPALFYVLAPFVAAMGSGPGIYLGSMAISGVSLVAVAALVWRWAGARPALWAVAAVEVFCLSVRVVTLREPWNPYEVVAPMALLGILAAGALVRRPGAWVWSAVVGSYLVQAHISTGPVAVVLVALPPAVAGARRLVHRRRAARRPLIASRLWTPIGLVLLVAVWVPVAIEAITDRPNNIQLLWDFYTRPHTYPSLRNALKVAANALSIVPFGNRIYVLTLVHPRWQLAVSLGLLVVFVVVALVVARRRRQDLAVGLAVSAVVIAGVGTAALLRAAGGIEAYFATWMAASPLMAMLALAVAVLGRAGAVPDADLTQAGVPLRGAHRQAGRGRVAGGGGAVATVVGIVVAAVSVGAVVRSDLRMTSVRDVSVAPDVAVARFSALVEAREHGRARVGFYIGSTLAWPDAAGVVAELDSRGVASVVAPSSWVLYFGPQDAPGPAVASTYSFFTRADYASLHPAGRVLAATNGVVLLVGAPAGSM